jgi:hypothetical protein
VSKQLDLFAEAIASRVARLLSARPSLEPHAEDPDSYSSLALPPDCTTRRVFADVCRGIPSATKRGKTWMVSRADWDFARGSR